MLNQGAAKEVDNGQQFVEKNIVTRANMAMSEMDYREAVRILMQSRSSKPISNGIPMHAAILYETFFEFAEHRVQIFCHNLSSKVFGISSVVEAARVALEKRQIAIDILIQADKPDEGPFVDFLREHKNNPLLVFRKAVKDNARKTEVNFSLMDCRALRYERDRDHIRAFAIMSAPSLATLLTKKFEHIFKDAIPAYESPFAIAN